jgi:hypothetical protein
MHSFTIYQRPLNGSFVGFRSWRQYSMSHDIVSTHSVLCQTEVSTAGQRVLLTSTLLRILTLWIQPDTDNISQYLE